MGPVCYAFSKTGDKRRTSRGRPWWEGERAKAVELSCLPAVAEVPAVENATLVWWSGLWVYLFFKKKRADGLIYKPKEKRGRKARQGRRKVRKGWCATDSEEGHPLKWPSSATVELEAREAASKGVTR